jgi:peroxiredoxin
MKLIPAFVLLLIATATFSAQTGDARPSASRYDFAAMSMDGQKIDTSLMRGKIVVFNLWFINCPNCVEEIKLLNQLVTSYQNNKDVVFIGLAASRKGDVEKFLKKNPFKYTTVPDAAQIILSKFGSVDKKGAVNMPFPMHFVLDRNGNAVVSVQGIKGVDAVKKELLKQTSAPPRAANTLRVVSDPVFEYIL